MMVAHLPYASRGQVLAEVLTDVETDPDDLVRLRLIARCERCWAEVRRGSPAEQVPRRRGWASRGILTGTAR